MPDLPFRITVTDAGTAVLQRFGATAQRLGGVGRRVGGALSRGFSLAQGAIGSAVSRVFNLRNALLGLGAGLAIRKIVNVFGDFERQMNLVRVLTGATATEFEQLTEQAKQLGITTKFSAREAAEGMSFLAKAGFEANEVLAALPATLTLAAAANLDLGQSADIVTNILTGLRIPIEELGRATDVLTQAFTSSNTDLGQLGQAFKFAGPIATTAGVEFEEVATVLSFLGDAGIQASMAGTTLRGAIAQLLKPSREAQKIFDDLGVTVTTAEGNLRPFAEIIEDLQPIANDATKILTIFGRRASGISTILQRGAPEFSKFADTLRNSVGRAAEVAEAQMKGLSGAIIRMRSAVEGAVLEIGNQLSPTLIEAADAVQVFGRNIATAIQGLVATSKQAGEASQTAFKDFVPSAITLVRAINAVRKAWLGLGLVASVVERAFLEVVLFLNQSVFGPLRTAVFKIAEFIVLTVNTIRQNVSQALAFLVREFIAFISTASRVAAALPTQAAAELQVELVNLSTSLGGVAENLEDATATSGLFETIQRTIIKNAKAQEEVVNLLSAALRTNAKEIETTAIEIAKLDQQSEAIEQQLLRTAEALKAQAEATREVGAASRSATTAVAKLQDTFRPDLFLAFDIDPSTGFGELQQQLATIGPNAVKAGTDFQAAFERIKVSGAAVGPEQFEVFQQQRQVLEELIRVGDMLPDSIRASFDEAIPAVIAGQASLTDVTRQALDARRRLTLQNASQTLSVTGSLFGALANLSETAGDKSFETTKKFRIAEAIINGAAGVSRAFAELPFPAAIAAAAVIAINTIAQVRKIQATQPGGGGGGGGGGITLGGGGGGGAPPGLVVPAEPAEMERGQQITISVAGFIGDEAELASQLSNVIREARGDGVEFGLETSR